MPRAARVVIPGMPHHVTQRGNRRQSTFFRSSDYALYLSIAAEELGKAGVEVWSYCLMPNHVHFIAVPASAESLATGFGRTHLRYTHRINLREEWTGSLWQGRFASFAMDTHYLAMCAAYVAMNPVRSHLVSEAQDWPWSSVRAHLGLAQDPLIAPGRIAELLARYPYLFAEDVEKPALALLRQSNATGEPLLKLQTREARSF